MNVDAKDTFFRMSNLKLFLSIPENDLIKEYAKKAGLSIQHSSRLLKVWKKEGWLIRDNGKYVLSSRGKQIYNILQMITDNISLYMEDEND